jgi:hypothetical protein
MVAVTEAGRKETVFKPKKATMIKKKVNKIFVLACLFIAAKIRRIDGMDHLKNKFNTIELTTCRAEDFCSTYLSVFRK